MVENFSLSGSSYLFNNSSARNVLLVLDAHGTRIIFNAFRLCFRFLLLILYFYIVVACHKVWTQGVCEELACRKTL